MNTEGCNFFYELSEACESNCELRYYQNGKDPIKSLKVYDVCESKWSGYFTCGSVVGMCCSKWQKIQYLPRRIYCFTTDYQVLLYKRMEDNLGMVLRKCISEPHFYWIFLFSITFLFKLIAIQCSLKDSFPVSTIWPFSFPVLKVQHTLCRPHCLQQWGDTHYHSFSCFFFLEASSLFVLYNVHSFFLLFLWGNCKDIVRDIW